MPNRLQAATQTNDGCDIYAGVTKPHHDNLSATARAFRLAINVYW